MNRRHSNAGLYASKLDKRLCVHHDDTAPSEYVARSEWAMEKLKTHKPVRCPGCGLWKQWTVRPKPLSARQHERAVYGK